MRRNLRVFLSTLGEPLQTCRVVHTEAGKCVGVPCGSEMMVWTRVVAVIQNALGEEQRGLTGRLEVEDEER